MNLAVHLLGEILPHSMENLSNDSRKRKLSPGLISNASSSQSDVTNQRMGVNDDEPPQKKQKGAIAPITEELTCLQKEPYPNLRPDGCQWLEDSETTAQLLSTYTKPLPITSIQLENLTGKPMKPDTDWTAELSSSKIAILFDEGVDDILEILKVEVGIMNETIQRSASTATMVEKKDKGFDTVATGHEETLTEVLEREKRYNEVRVGTDHQGPTITAEMGVETEEPMSDVVGLLEERIAILHTEKKELQKVALNNANDLNKAKASIEAFHSKYAEEKQKFEEQMAASMNKTWNEHVEVLNRHKKKIIEDAKLNQKNKELLMKVKARLKEEIQGLSKEKTVFREETQRCEMESKKLEEEKKEHEKVQERLIIKERNECWMLKKLKSQGNALEVLQVEKEKWEKEREDVGIVLRKLKADLAEAKQKILSPMELEGDSKV